MRLSLVSPSKTCPKNALTRLCKHAAMPTVSISFKIMYLMQRCNMTVNLSTSRTWQVTSRNTSRSKRRVPVDGMLLLVSTHTLASSGNSPLFFRHKLWQLCDVREQKHCAVLAWTHRLFAFQAWMKIYHNPFIYNRLSKIHSTVLNPLFIFRNILLLHLL